MAYDLYDRVLGGLIGAAAGDGMGAATEARTTEQIKDYFGDLVRDFETPPNDTFARGNPPGRATDDFSSAYFIARGIVQNGGAVDKRAVADALIAWSEYGDGVFFDRFAGPTTRLAIRRFKGEAIAETHGVRIVSRQATNGGAMRVSPIGLLNPGDPEKTVQDSLAVVMLTHDNYLAISGACAISCAVSQALMPDADVYNILQAAFYGAREGERLGLAYANDTPGPSVLRRMEKAVEIGLGEGSFEEKIRDIGEIIGAGLHVSEAVPAAIGFFAAAKGDAAGTIFGAVNVGYDTDTIATMCGAIAGAYRGAAAFPAHYLPLLEKANGLDIQELARGIAAIAAARSGLPGGPKI
ncbi:MAG: ADP-ribosylglycohydrolase family protein [Peptococcaceae bacterium]|jgi:ADP-ribosylglycohydrolase|nr:ADP-ribosylglycohydrolase family protein [Peptococcaceae bacterium]